LDKAPDAFRTISEVADDLDIPQHVLRFWETRFTQIKPMKRSGGRRYYRPDDVDLLRGIRRLLYGEGYTIRGVQRILKENGIKSVQGLVDAGQPVPSFALRHDSGASPIDEAEHDEAEEIDDEADGVEEADGVDENDEIEDDEEEEVVASPVRREPQIAAPLPRANISPRREPVIAPVPRLDSAPVPPSRPAAPAIDTAKLRDALSDLVACRQLLDAALKDG
jgi:DNA-binding transcriptional MerR regulator